MPLHREMIHAFRLGHAAESFNVWNDNLPLSRHDAYSSLNELSWRVDHYRPDLMDAFMMGRGAARLVILLAKKDNNNGDLEALLENTKQGMEHGAKQLGIATSALEKWIRVEILIHDVRKSRGESTLITAHIGRLEKLVGQRERAEKFHFEGDVIIAREGIAIKGTHNILNGAVINSTIDNILDDRGDDGEAAALLIKDISEHVANADNVNANELWEEFNKKLVETPQRKSVLNSIWQSLVEVLPSVAKIAEAAGGIAKLCG